MTKAKKGVAKEAAAIIPLEREVIRASVPLTDHELLKKGKQMSARMRQCQELEEALKTYQTQEKAKIKSVESEVLLLQNEINSGSEIRDVECEIIKDTANKERLWRSVQTGEILKREAFRKEDYQLMLGEGAEADALFPDPESVPE